MNALKREIAVTYTLQLSERQLHALELILGRVGDHTSDQCTYELYSIINRELRDKGTCGLAIEVNNDMIKLVDNWLSGEKAS